MSPVSRRFVLTGAALTSASLLVPIAARPACAQRNGDADYEITDWILIAAGGQVTLGLSQPEVGQGSYTALPQILAEELDADWQRVKVRVRDRQGRLQDRVPAGGAGAERRRLDVDHGAVLALAHRRRRRA